MIERDKSLDFLIKEYSENYTHMRHYDNLSYSIIKFLLSLNLAVLSAGVTVYNIFKFKKDIFIESLGYVLIAAFIIGVVLLAQTVRIRVYFIIVARHVNRVRKFFADNMEISFDFGDMFLDPQYPFFHVLSLYALIFYLIVFLNSAIFSIGISCILDKTVKIGAFSFVVIIILQLALIIGYLKYKEKNSHKKEN